MKKTINIFFNVISFIIPIIIIIGIFFSLIIPDDFNISRDMNIENALPASVTAEYIEKTGENSYIAKLKIFGIFPLKTVNVIQSERPCLIPCGTPFGIKMLCDGVIVTGFGKINQDSDPFELTPAGKAGICVGDIITEVNEKRITSSSEFIDIVINSIGSLKMKILRNEEIIEIIVDPQKDDDGNRKIGVWVRDSTAGIGTMTFYDEKTGKFAGLGHAVCDADTSQLMPLYKGELVPAIISTVKKGVPGIPGELTGVFVPDEIIGKMDANTNYGIYSTPVIKVTEQEKMPIAYNEEIENGKAYILTTLNGNTPEKFEIEVEKISENDIENKNIIIKVTDKTLLEKAGGIVQGMSGSPIIQNNKLIGAVTHVFINDPTHGYGVSIENMYNDFCSFYSNEEAAYIFPVFYIVEKIINFYCENI